MLTLHAADALLPDSTGPLVREGAVLVDGAVVGAVGPSAELVAAHPTARLRRWPGLITPGLVNVRAAELLECAYHPDPREAHELGTEPLTGEALAALAPDEERWGAGARRGLQRMLRHGTTAVAGEFTRPSVRTAVARSGLRLRQGPGAPAGEDPRARLEEEPQAGLDVLRQVPLAAAFDGALRPGAPADLAVFDVTLDDRSPAEILRAAGATSCVATVLAGRLVHRRR